MRQQPSKTRAETRVVNKYHQLYKPLIELVDALQDLEPGGTLVDSVKLGRDKTSGRINIQYTARPVILCIENDELTFILKVVDKKYDSLKPQPPTAR